VEAAVSFSDLRDQYERAERGAEFKGSVPNGAELRAISCLKVKGLKVKSPNFRALRIVENVRTKGLLTFDFQTFDTPQLVGGWSSILR